MFFIFGSIKIVNAQDLIVTAMGDSLLDSNFIHFTHRRKDGNKKIVVPLSGIKYYVKDFFPTTEMDLAKTKIAAISESPTQIKKQ